MRCSGYLDGLQSIPQFRHLRGGELTEIGQLVDSVDLPRGAIVGAIHAQDVVLTYAPARVLVIARRALPRMLELAPDLAISARRSALAQAFSRGDIGR